jgi:hypothetical protein
MAVAVPSGLLRTPPVERLTSRPGRLVAGLLVVGAAAGAVALFAFAREWSTERVTAETSVRVGRAVSTVARLDALLRTFAATRESETSWFGKASTLMGELDAEARALDGLLPGISTAPRGRIAELLPVLSEAIERARVNAEASRTLMALDVIETNGLPASESLLVEADNLRTSTDAELAAARSRWRRWLSASLGTWASTWAIGMIVLLRRNAASAPGVAQPPAVEAATAPPSVAPGDSAREPASRAVSVNFSEVAVLCQTIAQLREENDLPGIMATTTRLLGASGVVMWVPQGDGLVVGTFHGYARGLAERLGRVKLSDDNLLTQTWHRHEAQVAPADSGRKAALVMPILGTSGIAGILAIELQPGVEPDAPRLAASRLLSAQLGAAVAVSPNDTSRAPAREAGERRVGERRVSA